MASDQIQCPACGKAFSTETGLKIHIRKTHSNGKGGKTRGPIKKPKDK